MTDFDPQNPFPLVNLESYSYGTAKEHAAKVDRALGFQIEKVEENLISEGLKPEGHWRGLEIQSLLTPYQEIRLMLELCRPLAGQTVIDLGCAYGRMAHVIHRHHPGVRFVGYEIEGARVNEGQRLLKPLKDENLRIEKRDLGDPSFTPELADFYFIYDFGTSIAIGKILENLKVLSLQNKFQVIARGRATRFQIHRDHPWLAEVNPPRHTTNFSIFYA